MAYKKWLFADVNKETAKLLAEECDVDAFLALIACARGYNEPALLDELLSDEIMLSPYYELPNIETAAAVINEAITLGKKIRVFGDYDCDGVTATALLYGYLSERGAAVTYHIPDRFSEGYGMSLSAIDAAAADGIELIVTVDNGISCVNEVDYANSLGITTVITDHHLPHDVIPNAAAVVDPHLKGSACFFRDICGVFVAFKLVCALSNAEPEQLAYKYADLVAIGTVADVMPLCNENRDIVKVGLKAINNTSKQGIVALLNAAGLNRGSITAGNISYGLSPRINAAGRMDSAELAFRLLNERDILKASALAEQLDKLNAARQKIEQQISKEATALVEANGYNFDRVIVVAGENWHKGVIGIAASRLAEKYGKPALVLSIDESGEVSGSGRSIEGFNLYEALESCENELTRFGGHALAAGVGLKREKIDGLRKNINKYAAGVDMPVPVLRLDCKLNPAGLNLDLADALSVLEPYGKDNPTPIFAICGLTIERITPLSSGKHSKLLLSKNATKIEAMAFSVSPDVVPFKIGDIIDIAAQIDANEYMGKRSLSVIIKNWRKAELDEDALFSEIALYEAFRRGENKSYGIVSRDDVAFVYRAADNTTAEAVRQGLINTLGYFKTMIGLDVLYELKLIEEYTENGILKIRHISGVKVNLNDSQILKQINM